ncbi:hypothetical protein MGN70_001524 [Eutypa lata]|uniref:Uncharacterized protein n=1 Tax=Eutypa lata (strain UCR-EL1) TaxID=1287681 RepID=M7SCP9_EUTLA|nr:hypothetical protein UCREL1_9047 [Eutypa lata UCREL1]KAI1256400.1 hypothetical protein MGN70_001524 [Eutypa lata]
MASTSSMSARSRSPNDRISSESSSSSTVFEKLSAAVAAAAPQQQPQQQHATGNSSSICTQCDKRRTGGGEGLNIPLIAVFRLLAASVTGSALVRIHTKADAAWWPPEHKLLFNLCWVAFVWNVVAALGAVLGYAYFPSPRRTCGLPPVSLSVGGRNVMAFGGPDEDEAEARRRTKRMCVSLFDLVLALSVLSILLYSTQSMEKWWGSRYVGLRPRTTVMIVFVVLSGVFVAFFQLFQFVEAKVINIRLTVQDTYDRGLSTGGVQL